MLLQRVKTTCWWSISHVLIRFFSFAFYLLFTHQSFTRIIRYECALLKNKREGTPVIPVFAAELTGAGSFAKFDMKEVRKTLPKVPHARQATAARMIAKLR